MNVFKKIVVFVFLAVLLVLVIPTRNINKTSAQTITPIPGDDPIAIERVTPITQIWDAINDLRNQIANIQLTPGSKGDKGDRGPAGASLKVVDANGVDIGLYLGDAVWLSSLKALAKINFSSGAIDPEIYYLGLNNHSLGYAEENCSGQAYLEDGNNNFYKMIIFRVPNGSVLPQFQFPSLGFYYLGKEKEGKLSNVNVKSLRVLSQNSGNFVCVNSPVTYPESVALDLVDGSSLFTAPLRIVEQ